jgi:Fic family protein
MYIYQRKKWPNFFWNEAELTDLLAEVHYMQGLLLGRMRSLGFSYQNEASLAILTHDVIKTSEIEGEKLDYEQVRSSLAKRLGINIGVLAKAMWKVL